MKEVGKVSERCLEDVLKVSGRCLDGVSKVSGRCCGTCLEGIWKESRRYRDDV